MFFRCEKDSNLRRKRFEKGAAKRAVLFHQNFISHKRAEGVKAHKYWRCGGVGSNPKRITMPKNLNGKKQFETAENNENEEVSNFHCFSLFVYVLRSPRKISSKLHQKFASISSKMYSGELTLSQRRKIFPKKHYAGGKIYGNYFVQTINLT